MQWGAAGRGGDAVAVLAAVTAAGNIELVTLQRGAVCPLSATVSVSLGAFLHPVTGSAGRPHSATSTAVGGKLCHLHLLPLRRTSE